MRKSLAKELRERTNAVLRREVPKPPRPVAGRVSSDKSKAKPRRSSKKPQNQPVKAAPARVESKDKLAERIKWQQEEAMLAQKVIAALPQIASNAADDGKADCLALYLQDGHRDQRGGLHGAAEAVKDWAKKAGLTVLVFPDLGLMKIRW